MANKRFSRKDIETRNHKNDAVFIIDNVVYNVTSFLEDHPGGLEILIDNAGKDASKCFHDVGHTEEARELMKTYAIGKVLDEEKWEVKKKEVWMGSDAPVTLEGVLGAFGPPLALAVIAIVVYLYMF